MEQVFALQIDARPTQMLAEPRSKLERRRTSCEILKKRMKLRLKLWILARRPVRALEFFESSNERFRNIASPVGAETPMCIGHRLFHGVHLRSPSAAFTAHINATIRAGSFLPGRASTPLHTSTAYGRTTRIASATFSGVRPPARKMRSEPFELRTMFQLNVFPVPP